MGRGERRFYDRVAKTERVVVQWDDAAQQTVRVAGSLADLSKSGARLLLDRPLPVSTALRVTMDGQERSCTVRNCLKRIRGYAIGVQFDNP